MGGESATAAAGGTEFRRHVEAVVSEYETALLRYAARLLRNPTLAQDAVQNVFAKLVRGWKPGMKPTSELKAWLYRVTHNEVVDIIRREERLRTLHTRHAEEKTLACEDGRNCGADEASKMELVLSSLTKLHPAEQQVILLRLQEGLSYHEISAVTGRTEGNVGCILHHATRKLARMVRTPEAGAVAGGRQPAGMGGAA